MKRIVITIIIALLGIVFAMILLSSHFFQQTLVPSKNKITTWATSGSLSSSIDWFRTFDIEALYSLEFTKDGLINPHYSYWTEDSDGIFSSEDGKCLWKNAPTLSENLSPLFSKYKMSSILVAFDNAGHISVRFCWDRVHINQREEFSRYLIWVDDDFTGIRKDSDLGINDGAINRVLDSLEAQQILGNWYYWAEWRNLEV